MHSFVTKKLSRTIFCEFLKKTIVIISEQGDPDTSIMYHELSVRYLLWVVQIPPICTAY